MYINLQLLLIIQSLITLTHAMYSPINADSENQQRQVTSSQIRHNPHYNLVIIVKQLAQSQKLELKELCHECYHFKKLNGRLPIITEATVIAANLKKQYIRQEEISNDIMSHLFSDNDNIQSPSLEGYHHADSIVDHLDI